MKCEPNGTFNFNSKKCKTPRFAKCITSTITINFYFNNIKHVSLVEGTVICLNIPIIHKSCAIKYIVSKPQVLRTKLVIKSRILGFHPIYIYIFKLIQFEQLTFAQYF
jgi:hypothetical protein